MKNPQYKRHIYILVTLLTSCSVITPLNMASAETVKHDLGTTEVNHPKRIVVLEYSFADTLASVGVKPVGMAMEQDGLPYLKQALGTIPSVGTRVQPNLEAIAILKPDLIIADTSRHKDIYQKLQSIAPTIALNSRYGGYDDIINQYGLITRLVGKGILGTSKVINFRQQMEDVRHLNKLPGKVLIGNSYSPTSFEVYNNKTFVGEFLGHLGLPSLVEGKEAKIDPMSLEGVLALSPKRVVILENKSDGSIYDTWKDNPIWKNLPAAKNQQVFSFDRNLWAKGRGLMAADLMLKQVKTSGLFIPKS